MIDASAAAIHPHHTPTAPEEERAAAVDLRLFLLTWAGGLIFFLTYLG